MNLAEQLRRLDAWLLAPPPVQGFWMELGLFGLKQARACLFAVLLLGGAMLVPTTGLLGLPRYDAFLLLALAIQFWMVWTRLETREELLAISVFHGVGFAMEVFKTSSGIQSWAYPEFAYTKLLGVPLFSGFMYAAVGSYLIQGWRFLHFRVRHHPPYGLALLAAVAIYANFYAHHFIGDYRWYITAYVFGLYARTTLVYRPQAVDRRIPLLAFFILMGLALWLAENLSTFIGFWKYPHQLGAWAMVHLGKWSSWALLIIMTFTIITQLKHIRTHIHVPD